MKKQHILIIEGFTEAHTKLINSGNIISWMTNVNRMKNRNGYFKKIGIDDEASVDEWLTWAKTLNSIRKIDKIVNFSEDNQDKAAYIAKYLGIEYHTIETIETVNNKVKMRSKLNNLSTSSIKFKHIKSLEEIPQFYSEINKPFILKPLSGRGSESIHLIHNENEAKEIINLLPNDFEFLAEEFLEGKEYSVEVFSQKGSHTLLAITEKFKTENFVEIGHCVPARLSNTEKKEIETFVFNVLNNLGIKSGITHTEIILNDNYAKLVETHVRIGGDSIRDLVRSSFDIDMLDLWIDSILNNDVIQDIEIDYWNPKAYSTIYYRHSNTSGLIKDIKIENPLDKDIIQLSCIKEIGDNIVPTNKSRDRLAFVIATAKTPEESINMAKSALEKIKISIAANPNDQICDNSNPNYLESKI